MQKNALLGAALLVAAPALAQKVANDSLSATELQEAQVVATRAGSRTPITNKTLTKKEIETVNFGQDLPYLLSTMPGVTAASDAGNGVGYTYLRVRGSDPTRINVTANGIPINDAESSSVFWVNMADFASNVQSIQVQRGVGTSTNGAGAFGASVNMQTDYVPREAFLGFDASGGSFGTHKESLLFGTGLLKKHFALSGRLSHIASNGFIDRATSRLNSYFIQAAYLADRTALRFITFNGTERSYLSWEYATKEAMKDNGRSYNPSGLWTNANGKTQFYKNQVDDYHQQHYQLLLNQYLAPSLTLNAALHYTNGLGYYETVKKKRLYEYGVTDPSNVKRNLVRRKYSGADFYGTVLSLLWKTQRLEASFGGGYNKYDGDHYGNLLWVEGFAGHYAPNQEYYRNKTNKQDANAYARAEWQLLKPEASDAPSLVLSADAQYRHVGIKMRGTTDEFTAPNEQIQFSVDRSFNFFNPKAGATFQMGAHRAYASFAVAHKEPTRNDYENAIWTAEPKHETLHDFELGYSFTLPRLMASINFYNMQYRDQFVLTGEQDQNGEFLSKNAGKSYRRGLEFELRWHPLDCLTWQANATWSRNRIIDNKMSVEGSDTPVNLGSTPISFTPSLTANNVLAFAMKGWRATLTTRFVGEQYLTNTGFRTYTHNGAEESLMLDAYCASDLDVSYEFSKLSFAKRLTLGATVYNIFNAKYNANGGAFTDLRLNSNGKVEATQAGNAYAVFSAQAPAHFLVHLSWRL